MLGVCLVCVLSIQVRGGPISRSSLTAPRHSLISRLACVLSIQRGAYTADYEAASVPLKPLNGGGDGSLTGSRRGSEGSLAAKEAEAGEVLPTPSPPDERLAG